MWAAFADFYATLLFRVDANFGKEADSPPRRVNCRFVHAQMFRRSTRITYLKAEVGLLFLFLKAERSSVLIWHGYSTGP